MSKDNLLTVIERVFANRVFVILEPFDLAALSVLQVNGPTKFCHEDFQDRVLGQVSRHEFSNAAAQLE